MTDRHPTSDAQTLWRRLEVAARVIKEFKPETKSLELARFLADIRAAVDGDLLEDEDTGKLMRFAPGQGRLLTALLSSQSAEEAESHAGQPGTVAEFAAALSEKLLGKRDEVHSLSLSRGSRSGGLEEAAGIARSFAESWRPVPAEGGDSTADETAEGVLEVTLPAGSGTCYAEGCYRVTSLVREGGCSNACYRHGGTPTSSERDTAEVARRAEIRRMYGLSAESLPASADTEGGAR